jgi:hypothetical protein
MVFKCGQIDPAPPETDTFSLKQESLLQGALSGQRYPSACTQHPLPGKTGRGVQHPRYLAGAAGEACSGGHGSISAYFAAGNGADCSGHRGSKWSDC